MSRLTAMFAGTSAIAAVMVAYLWHQLQGERDQNRQMQVRVAQLEIDVSRARQRALDAPGEGPAAREALTAGVATAERSVPMAVTSAENPAGESALRVTSINMNDLMKDPEYREAQRAQNRLQMPQNYPDVAKVLGLSPAETEKFFDLLAKRQSDQMMLNADMAGGSEEARMEAQRKATETMRKGQAEVADFLGPVREQAWQEYQQTLGARKQVGQLGTTLTASGHSLSDSQSESLLATMATEQQRLKEETRYIALTYDPRSQSDRQEATLKATEESNQRIVDAARSYLNPQQLAALKSSMAQRSAMARAVSRAQRAQQQGE